MGVVDVKSCKAGMSSVRQGALDGSYETLVDEVWVWWMWKAVRLECPQWGRVRLMEATRPSLMRYGCGGCEKLQGWNVLSEAGCAWWKLRDPRWWGMGVVDVKSCKAGMSSVRQGALDGSYETLVDEVWVWWMWKAVRLECPQWGRVRLMEATRPSLMRYGCGGCEKLQGWSVLSEAGCAWWKLRDPRWWGMGVVDVKSCKAGMSSVRQGALDGSYETLVDEVWVWWMWKAVRLECPQWGRVRLMEATRPSLMRYGCGGCEKLQGWNVLSEAGCAWWKLRDPRWWGMGVVDVKSCKAGMSSVRQGALDGSYETLVDEVWVWWMWKAARLECPQWGRVRLMEATRPSLMRYGCGGCEKLQGWNVLSEAGCAWWKLRDPRWWGMGVVDVKSCKAGMSSVRQGALDGSYETLVDEVWVWWMWKAARLECPQWGRVRLMEATRPSLMRYGCGGCEKLQGWNVLSEAGCAWWKLRDPRWWGMGVVDVKSCKAGMSSVRQGALDGSYETLVDEVWVWWMWKAVRLECPQWGRVRLMEATRPSLMRYGCGGCEKLQGWNVLSEAGCAWWKLRDPRWWGMGVVDVKSCKAGMSSVRQGALDGSYETLVDEVWVWWMWKAARLECPQWGRVRLMEATRPSLMRYGCGGCEKLQGWNVLSEAGCAWWKLRDPRWWGMGVVDVKSCKAGMSSVRQGALDGSYETLVDEVWVWWMWKAARLECPQWGRVRLMEATRPSLMRYGCGGCEKLQGWNVLSEAGCAWWKLRDPRWWGMGVVDVKSCKAGMSSVRQGALDGSYETLVDEVWVWWMWKAARLECPQWGRVRLMEYVFLSRDIETKGRIRLHKMPMITFHG